MLYVERYVFSLNAEKTDAKHGMEMKRKGERIHRWAEERRRNGKSKTRRIRDVGEKLITACEAIMDARLADEICMNSEINFYDSSTYVWWFFAKIWQQWKQDGCDARVDKRVARKITKQYFYVKEVEHWIMALPVRHTEHGPSARQTKAKGIQRGVRGS